MIPASAGLPHLFSMANPKVSTELSWYQPQDITETLVLSPLEEPGALELEQLCLHHPAVRAHVIRVLAVRHLRVGDLVAAMAFVSGLPAAERVERPTTALARLAAMA